MTAVRTKIAYVAVRSKRLKSTLKVVTQYLMAGAKLKNCIGSIQTERAVDFPTNNTLKAVCHGRLTCVAMLHIWRAAIKLSATMKPFP